MNEILKILEGIDLSENDSDEVEGWWETSTGAKFGAKKLEEVLAVFKAQEEKYNKLKEAFEGLAGDYARLRWAVKEHQLESVQRLLAKAGLKEQ